MIEILPGERLAVVYCLDGEVQYDCVFLEVGEDEKIEVTRASEEETLLASDYNKGVTTNPVIAEDGKEGAE